MSTATNPTPITEPVLTPEVFAQARLLATYIMERDNPCLEDAAERAAVFVAHFNGYMLPQTSAAARVQFINGIEDATLRTLEGR